MGFWDLSDGGTAADTGTSYEVPSGNIEPIPDGSSVMAMVEEAEWDTNRDGSAEFLSLKWRVLNPVEYQNRVVFHKLWVSDPDPSAKDEKKGIEKRDKARRMLAAIDQNASGGKLLAKPGKPGEDALTLHLCNKPMTITLKVWEIEDRASGNMARGNWVCAVAGKDKGIDVKPAAPKPAAKPMSQGSALDDEIPFAPY
jgi:hypothetical protein